MKEIFDNKYKLYFFSSILFFALAIITNIVPPIVREIFSYIVFPIQFFLLTFFYSKKHGLTWDIPIVLMIIYMVIGYLCLFTYMSGLIIVESLIFGFVANITIKITDDKKTNIKKNTQQKKIGKKVEHLLAFIMPVIFIIVLEVYYKMCTFGTPSLKIEFIAIIMLIILIYAIYILILSLIRDTFRANLVFSIIFLTLFIVNQMRIFYTSDTLLLTDFLFLQTTGEIANFVDVTFINAIKYILSPTIIVVAIFIYLLMISHRHAIKFKSTKVNIAMFISSFIIIIVLFFPVKGLDRFILNKVYDYNKVSDYTISVSNTRYYYKYGVIGGMYGKFLENRRYEPENYNEEELKYTINSAKSNKSTWGSPNVIVIFSESFWDISKLKEVKFDKDIISNYHSLQESGKLINMISPSYGGISANVEFEILTGGSLNYFSKGYVPYMQLYNEKLRNNPPSIIGEFKNNGYKSVILNSSSKGMFSCDKVYDYYDVDERSHLYDEINLNGKYVSDEYLTDRIIEYFNNKSSDEKTFYFTITMGGHMPYYNERYEKYDFSIVESPYNDDINGTLKAYAEGIYKADKELARLYEYINTLEENTLIVFFGDHLPHLQTVKGKDALFEVGYLNNNYDLESVYKQFNTEALILSNYDIEYDDTKYLSPDLLLTYIMSNMDIELSSYYKWLYTTIDTLPSSNYVVSIDKKGDLYYTLGLKGEMKEIYELRKKVQYMLFR